jgi:hypothetical protein
LPFELNAAATVDVINNPETVRDVQLMNIPINIVPLMKTDSCHGDDDVADFDSLTFPTSQSAMSDDRINSWNILSADRQQMSCDVPGNINGCNNSGVLVYKSVLGRIHQYSIDPGYMLL